MARPKQVSDRTTLAFPPGTFVSIAGSTGAIGTSEDKSDFIRAAVKLAIGIRRLPVFEDLKIHLLQNESLEDFCSKAVAHAIENRKAALSGIEQQKGSGAD